MMLTLAWSLGRIQPTEKAGTVFWCVLVGPGQACQHSQITSHWDWELHFIQRYAKGMFLKGWVLWSAQQGTSLQRVVQRTPAGDPQKMPWTSDNALKKTGSHHATSTRQQKSNSPNNCEVHPSLHRSHQDWPAPQVSIQRAWVLYLIWLDVKPKTIKTVIPWPRSFFSYHLHLSNILNLSRACMKRSSFSVCSLCCFWGFCVTKHENEKQQQQQRRKWIVSYRQRTQKLTKNAHHSVIVLLTAFDFQKFEACWDRKSVV